MTIRTNVRVTSTARSDGTGGAFRAPLLSFRTIANNMNVLQCRSAAGRALATTGLIVGCLSPFVHVHGQEGPGPDSPPPFFAILKSQAALSEGVTITERLQDRLALESGGADYRFTEHLSWHQLRLTFDLNRIADPEVVLTTFRAIKATMRRACGEGLLELNQVEAKIGGFALGRSTDGFMTTSYRSLSAEGLVGTFSCRKKGAPDGPPWRVQWDSGNRYPLAVAPANEWRFLIEGVGQDTFSRHRLRFDAHRRATDTLRSNVRVGAMVQVMADDLPAALLAKSPPLVNPHKHPYTLCALVTNLNSPLAQLQVQLDNFMIPVQKLFPAGRQVTAKEMGQHLDQKEPAQQACLL